MQPNMVYFSISSRLSGHRLCYRDLQLPVKREHTRMHVNTHTHRHTDTHTHTLDELSHWLRTQIINPPFYTLLTVTKVLGVFVQVPLEFTTDSLYKPPGAYSAMVLCTKWTKANQTTQTRDHFCSPLASNFHLCCCTISMIQINQTDQQFVW